MSARALLVVALAALGVAALGGCGSSGTATYVWVDLEAKPSVKGVTKVEVTVSQGGESITKTFGDGQSPFTLPTSFTVTPDSHLGTLTVAAVAAGADGVSLARGSVDVAVAKSDQPKVRLTLLPLDFQVNTTVAGMQIVTDYGSQNGRQLGAAADGSLVAVFENIPTNTQRYDGLGRLFDGDGAPRQNQVSKDKNDFMLNQYGTEDVYFAAVAVAPAGGFLSAWQDYQLSIQVRAFDANGTPSTETSVSAVDAAALGAVYAAAFSDGSYVAVWSQGRSSTDSTHEIRARLLDATGQPRRNATTGNDLDFPVGAVTAHGMEVPVAAVYTDQTFMIVWLDIDPIATAGGAVHGQRFSQDGGLRGSEMVIATLSLTYPEGPNVAATPDGYLVAYTDQGVSTDDTDVLVRFVSKDGLLAQPGYRVNTSTDGLQHEVALAVAADGSTLVVWSDDQARPDDNDTGSIRARALQPFGLPIGADFGVNTTTVNWQHFPSVAAAAHGAFFVTWQDESAVGPDTDQSGIRGRMMYPDYAPGGGLVGASCATAACDTELVCAARPAGSFCHIGCSDATVGQPCATYGGLCTSAAAAGTSGPVCIFR